MLLTFPIFSKRWQSENAVHNVTINLNLETQFQFISTILRFKTFRPAAMFLERSDNFGQTWKAYAYFSNNCPRDYPNIPERPRQTLEDVTCTSIYSQLTPSEGGVVCLLILDYLDQIFIHNLGCHAEPLEGQNILSKFVSVHLSHS